MGTLAVEAGLAEQILSDETVRTEFAGMVEQIDRAFEELDATTTEVLHATARVKLRGGFDISRCHASG